MMLLALPQPTLPLLLEAVVASSRRAVLPRPRPLAFERRTRKRSLRLPVPTKPKAAPLVTRKERKVLRWLLKEATIEGNRILHGKGRAKVRQKTLDTLLGKGLIRDGWRLA